MSRIPRFSWTLLVTASVAWVLYLLLGVAGWSSFSSDTVGHRFEIDILQLLLFGGWAALIVGLGGWMLSERELPEQGPSVKAESDRGLGTAPHSDGGPA
jgi:hypothetical protein